MIGWDDGWLSDASGSGPVVLITFCDWVGGAGGDFLDFSLMYASNLEITSLTRSFTCATFLSTFAMISASCISFVIFVNGCLDRALVSISFYSYNAMICNPIAFMHFCRALACDRAVGSVLEAFSSASSRSL